MASDVVEFQRQTFFTSLEEVKPKLPEALAMVFEKIRECIDDTDQDQKNVWSLQPASSDILRLLNDLNDALDECRVFVDHCKEVTQSVSLFNPFQHKLFIRNMKQKLKTISHELISYLENSGSPSMPQFPSGRFTSFKSIADYSQIIGFEEQEKKIRDFLISDSYTYKATGVYGMGGSGKTSLVLKVLNDPSVHFDQIIWLCLSDIHSRDHEDAEFFEVSIINFILCELGCDVDKWTEIHPTKDYLLKHLKKLLMNKRYLIVLDDVWEDNEFYSNLGDALPVENRLSEALPIESGGKIIMTSREKELCKKMVGYEKNLICMQPLNREICRMIMEQEIMISEYAEHLEDLLNGSKFVSIGICGPSSSANAAIVRKVLCSPSVCEKFEPIIWMPVSLIFSNHPKISASDEFLKHLLKVFGRHECDRLREKRSTLDNLAGFFRESLQPRESLIVLDDLVRENYDFWRWVSVAWPRGGRCTVIMTSKIKELIGIMACEELIHVRLPELGSDVVDLCGGLPFAAKTLASIIWEKGRQSSQNDMGQPEKQAQEIDDAFKLPYKMVDDEPEEIFRSVYVASPNSESSDDEKSIESGSSCEVEHA